MLNKTSFPCQYIGLGPCLLSQCLLFSQGHSCPGTELQSRGQVFILIPCFGKPLTNKADWEEILLAAGEIQSIKRRSHRDSILFPLPSLPCMVLGSIPTEGLRVRMPHGVVIGKNRRRGLILGKSIHLQYDWISNRMRFNRVYPLKLLFSGRPESLSYML